MKRLTTAGGFIRLDGNNETAISEDEARRLLSSTARDVDELLANMKANHGGKIKAEDLLLSFRYDREPVVTVDQGGPVMRMPELFSLPLHLEWMMELASRHAPSVYDSQFDRWVELAGRPDCQDQLAADLMEVLDNCAGPDITFTVNTSPTPDPVNVLGFWSLKEPPL